jgi:hypothetical protein
MIPSLNALLLLNTHTSPCLRFSKIARGKRIMTQKHCCVLPMTSCLVEGLGSWCVFVGVVQNPRQKAAHECWTSGFEFADKFINLFLFFALCCYSSSSLVFRTYRKSSIRHVMARKRELGTVYDFYLLCRCSYSTGCYELGSCSPERLCMDSKIQFG